MNCPMTAADCPSCDDSTGCKLLTCRARCVWPDCLCADPGDPRPLFCRAEPWANLGPSPAAQRPGDDKTPAPAG